MKMGKILPFVLSGSLVVSLTLFGTQQSHAAEDPNQSIKDKLIEQYKIGEIQTTPSGENFTIIGVETNDVSVGKTDAPIMQNGDIYKTDGSKVTKEEHQKDLNDIEKFKAVQEKVSKNTDLNSNKKLIITPKSKSNLITPMSTYYSWNYTESYDGISLNGAKKRDVTNTLKCPSAATGCSITVSVTGTNSQSFSSSVTSDLEKTAIKVGATYTWVTSVSTTQAYTISLPKGKTGKIVFTPKQHWTVGTSKEYLVNAESGYKSTVATHSNITSYSAMKLSTGAAAGEFAGVVY